MACERSVERRGLARNASKVVSPVPQAVISYLQRMPARRPRRLSRYQIWVRDAASSRPPTSGCLHQSDLAHISPPAGKLLSHLNAPSTRTLVANSDGSNPFSLTSWPVASSCSTVVAGRKVLSLLYTEQLGHLAVSADVFPSPRDSAFREGRQVSRDGFGSFYSNARPSRLWKIQGRA